MRRNAVEDKEKHFEEGLGDGAEEVEEILSFGQAVKKGFIETKDTFAAFIRAPKVIIGLNLINIIEGMAYFGTLTYLLLFMNQNVGLSDIHASYVVTAFMMVVTLSQLFFGGISDVIGSVRALGLSLIILLGSRFLLALAESLLGGFGTGLGAPIFWLSSAALLFAALSYGLYQPALYSMTRQYSDKKTSAVSYAMLYAGMNLGAFIIGLLLPSVRRFSAAKTNTNGYSGSLMFIAGLMVLGLLVYILLVWSKRHERPQNTESEETEAAENKAMLAHLSFLERLKRHPLADIKFLFFIFILIPVQTLFAYQNILVPAYLSRSYTAFPTISDNFETFSNLNPLIVFIVAPIIAALTARANVYKMMIIGTTVMALPTFLLCFGQYPVTFLTFVLIMSVGESMWQPRFLQHVAEIAPKDRVGAYIGVAQLPWFLTKFIVGLYAGYFLERYIPDLTKYAEAIQNPEMMWFFFGLIAIVSPIGLILGQKWFNSEKKTPKTN